MTEIKFGFEYKERSVRVAELLAQADRLEESGSPMAAELARRCAQQIADRSIYSNG